jgi:DNA transformation protein and related proteins
MPCTRTFVDHAVDLLSSLGPVQARAMFGGYGVYARGVMIGLLDGDELFLKADDETRERFRGAGCRMWVYPGMAETNYYRPPDEAHEDQEAMFPWARLGLEAAVRVRAAKVMKAAAAAARRRSKAGKAAAARRAAPRKPARSGGKRPAASPRRRRTR